MLKSTSPRASNAASPAALDSGAVAVAPVLLLPKRVSPDDAVADDPEGAGNSVGANATPFRSTADDGSAGADDAASAVACGSGCAGAGGSGRAAFASVSDFDAIGALTASGTGLSCSALAAGVAVITTALFVVASEALAVAPSVRICPGSVWD